MATGKTIYAVIQCRWEIPSAGRLRPTYLESPAFQLFRGYSPRAETRDRELTYTLTEGARRGSGGHGPKRLRVQQDAGAVRASLAAELDLPYDPAEWVFYGRVPTAGDQPRRRPTCRLQRTVLARIHRSGRRCLTGPRPSSP